MEVTFFDKQSKLRKWFEINHEIEQELWVGFYKKASGIESITWPESVDEALCFGWIDGIRKSINDVSYKIRFTPRRKNSIWSAVNLKRVPELIEFGVMHPSGMAAYEKRNDKKSKIYAYEQKNVILAKEYEQKLKSNKKAWEFFQTLPPSTKQPSIWWIMSAKKEETRLSRLATLIQCSEAEQRIPSLRRNKK